MSAISRTDAEVILAAVLQVDRTNIFAHPEKSLSMEQQEKWTSFVARRKSGEPVAYITGEKEFFGRMFKVDHRALIPRPATEGLVEEVMQVFSERTQTNQRTQRIQKIDSGIVSWTEVFQSLENANIIVDIGTGSGCIAITLAMEIPDCNIIATDSSSDALELARENAIRLGMGGRVTFLKGTLMNPIRDLKEPFFLVSNPPYISSDRALPSDIADFEPRKALFAGHDGMSVIRPLIAEAKMNPFCAGFALECEEWQMQDVRNGLKLGT